MAAVITSTAQTPITLEVVDMVVHNYVNKSAVLYGIFGDGEGEDINPRGAFIPGEILPNGAFGAFPEGGGYITPSGRTVQRMSVTFLRFDMSTSFTNDALESTVQMVQTALPANYQSDIKQFARQNNIMMYAGGASPAVPRATVLSVASPVVTFTAPEGTKKIFIGGSYEFRTSAGALRAGGPYLCTAKTRNTGTFSPALDASVAPTDGIFYAGSFGLEFHGLPYHVNAAVSGTYQGLNRNTFPPEFLPVTEDQTSQALKIQAMTRNQEALYNKRGASEVMPTCFWLCNPSQYTAYRNLGQSLGANTSSIRRYGANEKTLDPTFDVVEYASEKFYRDTDCPETDLYRLHPGYLRKYSFRKIGLATRGADAQGLLPVPMFNSSGVGNWSDNAQYVILEKEDMGCPDPAIAIRMLNLDTTGLPLYTTS